MSGSSVVLALGLAVITVATGALAQQRPSDADIFGSAAPSNAPAEPAPTTPSEDNPANATQPPPENPATASPSVPVAPPSQSPTEAKSSSASAAATQKDAARDSRILGSTETPMFTEEAAPEDPLKVGGQLYLRMQSTASQGQRFADFSLGSPSLADLYLDARPNDRVRGFVLGRMLYDPTLPASTTSSYTISPVSASGSTSGSQSLSSLFQQQTRDPKVYLDQLWLKFDIAHRVFVTAGKQHVRWGTARFWAPTDYLHLRPRNPLDIFDARTGTTMVKLHVPIESRQWNFYAYGISERQDPTPTLGSLAGAARAEFVVDTTELGLGIFGQKDRKPKYAFDLSTGIGDFDFYGELALRYLDDIDRVRYDENAIAPPKPAFPDPTRPWVTPDDASMAYLEQTVNTLYPTYRHHGIVPQAVGGVTYSRKYNDNDMFTVGAEYFYNGLGYHSPVVYPGLVLPHTVSLSDSANFFYLGRHYAALYITFPAPYSLDTHTFTLSTIGNLSDQSFITRLDYSLIVLTHVRFEAFVSGRYGNEEGEFRFGIRNLMVGTIPFSRPPAFMDLGVALRVAI